LIQALQKYDPYGQPFADASRRYAYQYDRAGNCTQEQVTIGATTTTTAWAYNVINQIQMQRLARMPRRPSTMNGRLTNDGMLTYTWNRADRSSDSRRRKRGGRRRPIQSGS